MFIIDNNEAEFVSVQLAYNMEYTMFHDVAL